MRSSVRTVVKVRDAAAVFHVRSNSLELDHDSHSDTGFILP
jgi:hypothetical protein